MGDGEEGGKSGKGKTKRTIDRSVYEILE